MILELTVNALGALVDDMVRFGVRVKFLYSNY